MTINIRYNNESYHLQARHADILAYVYRHWATGLPSPSVHHINSAIFTDHPVSPVTINRDVHSLVRLGLLVRTSSLNGVGITSDGMQVAQRLIKAMSNA